MQFEIDHSIAKKAEAGHGRPYPASSPFGGSCVSPRPVQNAAARFRQFPCASGVSSSVSRRAVIVNELR